MLTSFRINGREFSNDNTQILNCQMFLDKIF
jgi:hypothetical protein